MSTHDRPDPAGTPDHSPDLRHLPGRVALAWTLAGGVTAGGLLVASVTLSGNLSSGLAPTGTTLLFVLGALAGLFHGGVLGYLARDLDRPRGESLRSLIHGTGAALLAAPFAWLFTFGIAFTDAALAQGELSSILVVAFAWLAGGALCLWAAREGFIALRRAFLRWPERRYGSLITAGVLAILTLEFLTERPEIWGTDLQVRGLGAVILALGATLWIALPTVLAVLQGVHRLVGDSWFGPEASAKTEHLNRT